MAGLGASIPAASDASIAHNQRAVDGEEKAPTGLGAGKQPHKPPLYVPTKRQPRQPSRGSEDRGTVGAYKPKTGFSTAGLGSTKSSLTSENKPPMQTTKPALGGTRLRSELPETAQSKFV